MSKLDSTDIAVLKAKLNKAYGTARGPVRAIDSAQALPEDYVHFLSEIGGGTIGKMFFELYDEPLSSSYIYGNNAADDLKSLIFIGDDYNGFCVALDPNRNWAVVEVDKHSLETEVLAETLFDFLMKDWRLDPSGEQV
ncbi:SMI1/KNR4 family protein [Alisedimentitalea sp. MJ-SS2]|uniref:SMI1/KNR4 family protein n=1 Tax=Aliisedimentitalea sp. MJ-SS2 TaxID=3049795 RepID=UPI0029070DC5|nr:SMI1/KNR4 family protein [Alisedimentitalea sp. MJ-SS2]MDU8930049.1 SMI1/KNR4 family protein [Alisedimentitalea sp. MJ-SS2]